LQETDFSHDKVERYAKKFMDKENRLKQMKYLELLPLMAAMALNSENEKGEQEETVDTSDVTTTEVKEVIEDKKEQKEEKEEFTFHNDLKLFAKEPLFADVMLRVEGELIPAHKVCAESSNRRSFLIISF